MGHFRIQSWVRPASNWIMDVQALHGPSHSRIRLLLRYLDSKARTCRLSLVFSLAWIYQAMQPPPPKICGSPGGPPITAPRIKLRDGRHLAYKEHGVPKEEAKYKFIFVHGFDSSRNHAAVATDLSPDIAESLGICIVSFDRPGYGESDPDPKRTEKSIALDIEELADQLGFGPKFYVIGFSMGGQVVWGCLKYIPHRYGLVDKVNPTDPICPSTLLLCK
ncbi:hypothetical protein Ancab_014362 [Ancistrocladus abbreviatus]